VTPGSEAYPPGKSPQRATAPENAGLCVRCERPKLVAGIAQVSVRGRSELVADSVLITQRAAEQIVQLRVDNKGARTKCVPANALPIVRSRSGA